MLCKVGNKDLIKYQTGVVQRVEKTISITDILLSLNRSTGYFIPGEFGFKELNPQGWDKELNVIKGINYHRDQLQYYVRLYDSESNITHVHFEIFTRNIVYVETKQTVTHLD